MYQLVMPLALTCVQVHGHQGFGKQIIAGTIGAVVVAGGGFHGQVHRVQLGIYRYLRPHPCIAGVAAGISFPGFIAVLTLLRNGMKYPQAFAGADIEAANEAFHIFPAPGIATGTMGGANDDNIVCHDGGGVQTDVSGINVDGLVQVLLEIDDAIRTEPGYRISGASIQGNQLITGSNE